jgi:hypothetical protein
MPSKEIFIPREISPAAADTDVMAAIESSMLVLANAPAHVGEPVVACADAARKTTSVTWSPNIALASCPGEVLLT